MGGRAHGLRGFNQRGGAFEVSHCREFHRRKVQACPVQTNGCRRHQYVAHVDVRLNRAGRADTQESTNAQLRQLFNCNRGRRTADTGGAHNHRFAIQLCTPGGEFTMGSQFDRRIHQRGDLFHTLRVARDDSERSPL